MAKVLGLSFGRKQQNSDILVKEALMSCESAGHEVRFINVNDLDIKPCTGCLSCVIGMIAGFGFGACHLKDDFHILNEALLDCDALIVCSPVFETSPTGLFKTVCDRIGPSHDITFLKPVYEERLAAGMPADKMPDPRFFKSRVAALMTVGGAMTRNWHDFGMPVMFESTFSMGIDVIDTYKCIGAMAYEHVLGNDAAMARAAAVGTHIVEALAAGTDAERTLWRGDDQGVCPVCHQEFLSVVEDGAAVECPVCGIRGSFEVVAGKLRAEFPQSELHRSRLYWDGKLEHSDEIKHGAMTMIKIPDLKERLAKYRGYAE